MLGALRRHAKGWIAYTIVGLLVIALGIWGIGDIFKGRTDTAVAHVGERSISIQEFKSSFQREVRRLRRDNGDDFTAEAARAMGVPQAVLERLMRFSALDLKANDLGLVAPDDIVRKQIQSDSAFYGPLGTFDRSQFLRLIQDAGFTERSFIETVRNDFTRSQLIDAIMGGIVMPDQMAASFYRVGAERRVARYVIIPPDAVGALPPPTEEKVRSFYAANTALFQSPEFRRFTFVLIDPAAVAQTLEVKEDQIRQYYEFHKAEYETPEKRTLEQIVFPSEADARATADAIKGGQSFADAARARGLSADDVALGAKTRKELSGKLADVAFATAEGDVSAPVEGPFGWVLLRVVSITPGQTPTYEDVRDRIRLDIAREEADDRVHDISNKLEEERAGGAALDVAAKAAGLTAVAITSADAQGRDPTGKTIAALEGQTEILAAAFRAAVDEDLDIAETKTGGYFVVRVESISPPAPKPFDAVAADIRTFLAGEDRSTALAAYANRLVDQAKGGKSFDDIAKELGRAAVTSEPIPRNASNDTFSAEAITKLFEVPLGTLVHAPVGIGESIVLMKLEQIIPPSAEETASALADVKRRLGEAAGNELVLQYTTALEERYGVRINQRNLENALGES